MRGYFGGRTAVVKPTVELTGECSLEGCHRRGPGTELEGGNKVQRRFEEGDHGGHSPETDHSAIEEGGGLEKEKKNKRKRRIQEVLHTRPRLSIGRVTQFHALDVLSVHQQLYLIAYKTRVSQL